MAVETLTLKLGLPDGFTLTSEEKELLSNAVSEALMKTAISIPRVAAALDPQCVAAYQAEEPLHDK